MTNSNDLGFFVSIPHSGEKVPDSLPWLKTLDEVVLMRDVDRFVKDLYEPIIEKQKITSVVTDWSRYVVDLNRFEDEFDEDAVIGAPFPKGKHPKGLHWSITTFGEKLIPTPMSMDLHNELMLKYYKPFHDQVGKTAQALKTQQGEVYQLDLHSMPSLGTEMHPDPGEKRADIVISDYHGTSARQEFRDIVMDAYQEAGFQVAYNWPYIGGGITKRYGKPKDQHHCVQVELNRALYMDEETKLKSAALFSQTQTKLGNAIEKVMLGLEQFLGQK